MIDQFDNEDDAYNAEENLISQLRSENVLNYNIAGGGKGTGSGINHPMFGKKLSQKWIDNLSIASKIYNNKPEVIERHRANMINNNWIGENHPMFGKHHSEETKTLISAKGKGKKRSDETKNRLSKALTGRTVSEETRRKMSKSRIGKNTGFDNPNSKLTPENVEEIKKLIKSGLSCSEIAKLFNVSKTPILSIRKKVLSENSE